MSWGEGYQTGDLESLIAVIIGFVLVVLFVNYGLPYLGFT